MVLHDQFYEVNNHVSFLPNSVVMCYFIAVASVYGKSVAFLRAQLKLVSCWHFSLALLVPVYCKAKSYMVLNHDHMQTGLCDFLIRTNIQLYSCSVGSLTCRRAVTSSSWSSRLRS